MPGEQTITAKLFPEGWSSVLGQAGSVYPASFTNDINAAGAIGFTFGGMFAGHGVYAVGPVKFTINEFSVR